MKLIVMDSYIHGLHYTKDGNFNLSQHDKKMDLQDTPLTDGTMYYAHEKDYEEYKAQMALHKKENPEAFNRVLIS